MVPAYGTMMDINQAFQLRVIAYRVTIRNHDRSKWKPKKPKGTTNQQPQQQTTINNQPLSSHQQQQG